MPVIAEQGISFKWVHHGTGYATGPIQTHEHHVIPGNFSIHVGLSRVQATTGGPLGAAVGIMTFGDQDFGPDPANWPPTVYGTAESWTLAMQVTKGEMSVWEFFQIWT